MKQDDVILYNIPMISLEKLGEILQHTTNALRKEENFCFLIFFQVAVLCEEMKRGQVARVT